MLVRNVLRRASRSGEGVGWKTGSGPGGCSSAAGWMKWDWSRQYLLLAAWEWL